MFAIKRKKGNSQDHFPEIIETGILFAIILVVFHTVFEELAVIYNWSSDFFHFLDMSSFAFDLLFSIEFTARSILTKKRGTFRRYIFAERGWVDALTSFPLLFFVSGPSMAFYLMGGHGSGAALGFLQILKTAKAIRVTRVLRLIRVIKLFGKIQNTESRMTNRHVGTVATLGVVSLITMLVVSQFFSLTRIGDHADYIQKRKGDIEALFLSGGTAQGEMIRKYLESSPSARDVLRVTDPSGNLVFEREATGAVLRAGAPEMEVANGYKVVLSYHAADVEHSRMNLLTLFSILVLITSYVIFYSRIFAQQIADPIFIMDRGLREWDFNLEVKVMEDFRDEEVFHLARAFNVRWLPLKNRLRNIRKKEGETGEKSILKVSDFF